jgi:hypothetical protein
MKLKNSRLLEVSQRKIGAVLDSMLLNHYRKKHLPEENQNNAFQLLRSVLYRLTVVILKNTGKYHSSLRRETEAIIHTILSFFIFFLLNISSFSWILYV